MVKFLRLLAVLPIFGIAGLLYYCFLVVYRSFALLVVFNILFVFWLVSYVSLLFVHPGRVPTHLQTDMNYIELKTSVGDSSRPRYCNKCECFKPDRTHHCSVCGECVLKMDHHCPWILHCVGLNNQRLFIQFCFNTAFLSLFMSLSVYDLFVNGVTEKVRLQWEVMMVFLFGILEGVTMMAFAVHHVYLVVCNVTTIEMYEKEGTQFPQRVEFARLNPYDVGWRDNLQQVFGSQMLYYILPIPTLARHRHEFPEGLVWPLRLEAADWRARRVKKEGLMDMV